jgi:hypothetical protein
MAIQNITFGDKSDLSTTSVADANKIKASDMNEVKTVVNNNATETSTNASNIGTMSNLTTTEKGSLVGALNEVNGNLGNLCKLLWTGSFSSGGIHINGLSNYTIIGCVIDGVMCIGFKTWGFGGFVMYDSYALGYRAYRLSNSGDNLTIDSGNRGGSDGTNNLPITAIYGIL